MAILLTIVLTFFGAAACYHRHAYERLVRGAGNVPPNAADSRAACEALGGMVIWGAKLVAATWYQSITEFPALFVGA